MASPSSTCSSRTEYVCSYDGCYMIFTRPSRLACHARIHTGERPYDCTVEGCNKSYTRSAHLKRHLQASHAEISDKETHKCPHSDCGKEFGLIQNLKKHVLSAHQPDGLKYKCTVPECDDIFRKKHQLRDHLLKHEGATYLRCPRDGCVKQFGQKSHLNRHLKVHDGYVCSEDGCTENFTKFTLLRKHIAIAHKNWYSCADCGKQFARKLFLQAHLRTHTGLMVACTYEGCPRAYYDVKNLNTHIRSYHEGKKFVCAGDSCGRKFSTKQKLAQHVKIHDANKPLPKKKVRKPGRKKKSVSCRLTGLDEKTAQRCPLQSESEAEALPDIIGWQPSQSQASEQPVAPASAAAASSMTETRPSLKCGSQEKCDEYNKEGNHMMATIVTKTTTGTDFNGCINLSNRPIHTDMPGDSGVNAENTDMRKTSEAVAVTVC